MAKAMDLYYRAHYWYDNAPLVWWTTTSAAIVHPKTRSAGLKMASFGARLSWNVTAASARAAFGTTLVRGGTTTLGSGLGQVAAAIGVPVIAGYAASAYIGNRTGYDQATHDYLDFITGGVSPEEWWDAVTLSDMR